MNGNSMRLDGWVKRPYNPADLGLQEASYSLSVDCGNGTRTVNRIRASGTINRAGPGGGGGGGGNCHGSPSATYTYDPNPFPIP